jgi:peptidoglycan/LPS O-acetylase OafA/YrhL
MFNLLFKDKINSYPHLIILLALISIIFVRESIEAFLYNAFFVFLFYLFVYQKLTFLNNRILIFFGKISYPLYLLHQTIGFILIYNFKALGVPHFFSILLTILLIIGLSYLVYEYLEKPIIKKLK